MEYNHLHRDRFAGITTARPPSLPFVIATIYQGIGRGPMAFAAVRVVLAISIAVAGALAVAIAFEVTRRASSLDPSHFSLARHPIPWCAHFAALIALALALLDTTIRTYAVDFLSEPLALLGMTIFLWLALDMSPFFTRNSLAKSIALGVVFALLVYTRSMFIFWLPGVGILLGWEMKRGASPRYIAIFLLTSLLLLSPWMIRNCLVLQAFMPMGAQGPPSILGGYSDEALADRGNWHPDAEQRLQRKLFETRATDTWSRLDWEREMARAATRETKQWILSHRNELPRLMLARLTTHWGPYYGKSLAWRMAMIAGVVWLCWRRRPESIWLIGLPLISSLCIVILYETGGRFLVPLYPLLYSLASLGLAGIVHFIVNRIRRMPGATGYASA